VTTTKENVEVAIDKVKVSFTPKYWIDSVILNPAESGQSVFQEEEAAVAALLKILVPENTGEPLAEGNAAVLAEVAELIGLIETDDRILAETVIEIATANPTPGADGSCLANANLHMISAENKLLVGDPEGAIDEREMAWLSTQQELDGKTCSPLGSTPPTPPPPAPPVVIEITTNPAESGDITIIAGQIVVIKNGVTIEGDVKVEGGTLTVTEGSTIKGKIDAKDGATVTVEDGSEIEGDILMSGSGGSLTVTGSTVKGKVSSTEANLVSITSNIKIESDVISDKDVDVEIKDNPDIQGKIEVKDFSGTCDVGNNGAAGGTSGCP